MARFLVGTTPLVGAVGVALKLVEELVSRGHEVRWYAGRKFRAQVEAVGAVFEPMMQARDYSETPLLEAFPSVVGKTGLAALTTTFDDVFIGTAAGQVADVRAILSRFDADATLSDSVFLGFALAHDLGGPPWAKYGDSVLGIRSKDTAPHGLAMAPTRSTLGSMRNVLLHEVFGSLLLRRARRHLDRVRADLGLPAGPRYLYYSFDSPYLWLQCSVPSFEYPRRDLPPQVHFIGPSLPDPPADFTLPAWWPETSDGRRVVHVTQGTVATGADALLFPTIEALADEPVLVIATTGGVPVDAVIGTRTLPPNARVEAFLPHGALLPKVHVMVTNGGNNGVQAALAFGVPMVVAGNTEEKPEVAARVAWRGVGIDLKTGRPTPTQLRSAVRRVLTEPHFGERARGIAAEIAGHHPAREGADLLERLAVTKRRVERRD